MGCQRDVTRSWDEAMFNLSQANINFTVASSIQKPIPRVLPTPPYPASYSYQSSARHSPDSQSTDTPTTIHKEPVQEICDAAQTKSLDQWLKRFEDWKGGKERFCMEKELEIPMTPRDFLRFKHILDIDNKDRFPKYSFNASSSKLIFERMPSPIHEQVVSIVSAGFNLARNSLPSTTQRKIDIVYNQTFSTFLGDYKNFEKVPDTAVKVVNSAGIREVKFVLEVGWTESYNMLVQDAKTWLEGTKNVTAVMLVKLLEDPVYRCPTRHLSDMEFAREEFPNNDEITQDLFTLEGPNGPAWYKGYRWVGTITGFMEIWKRDAVTGSARRTVGPMYHLDMSNHNYVYFFLSDFMDVTEEENHPIPFNWGIFHENLGLDIRELAVDRCGRMLKGREGHLNLQDSDYQPLSPAGSA
ncbi:hypothetical protein C7212DRAFT_363029 [Tuber magnatum]|uniref:Uncharacterized protein n=1 Tax=Tuber magnatum TaxID=42249 RepID=A0A317SUL2_9PEZI|nr:hypothetical protein C7212DRAFT_363029 [Tuber magnatum]